MREIKLRAWDGEKMTNNILVGKYGTFWINEQTSNGGLDKNDSACITPFNTKLNGDAVSMQYVGICDWRAKEIYEGDIVTWTPKFRDTEIRTPQKIGVVEYVEQGCRYHINYRLNGKQYYKELVANGGGDYYFNSELEVIGNIYENPELLKA